MLGEFERTADDALSCKIYEPATDQVIVIFTWRMVDYLWQTERTLILFHNLESDQDYEIVNNLIMDRRSGGVCTVEFVQLFLREVVHKI